MKWSRKIELKHEIAGKHTRHVFVINGNEIDVDSSIFSRFHEGDFITIERALYSKHILKTYTSE